jgi:hypothetical protein
VVNVTSKLSEKHADDSRDCLLFVIISSANRNSSDAKTLFCGLGQSVLRPEKDDFGGNNFCGAER